MHRFVARDPASCVRFGLSAGGVVRLDERSAGRLRSRRHHDRFEHRCDDHPHRYRRRKPCTSLHHRRCGVVRSIWNIERRSAHRRRVPHASDDWPKLELNQPELHNEQSDLYDKSHLFERLEDRGIRDHAQLRERCGIGYDHALVCERLQLYEWLPRRSGPAKYEFHGRREPAGAIHQQCLPGKRPADRRQHGDDQWRQLPWHNRRRRREIRNGQRHQLQRDLRHPDLGRGTGRRHRRRGRRDRHQ